MVKYQLIDVFVSFWVERNLYFCYEGNISIYSLYASKLKIKIEQSDQFIIDCARVIQKKNEWKTQVNILFCETWV